MAVLDLFNSAKVLSLVCFLFVLFIYLLLLGRAVIVVDVELTSLSLPRQKYEN